MPGRMKNNIQKRIIPARTPSQDEKFSNQSTMLKPGFHLQQTPRPQHSKQSDCVIEQLSFPLIVLYQLKIGRCRGRNWLNGNLA